MKNSIIIIVSLIVASCNMEYEQIENDVQGYNWLGVNGNEEIRNDTIYTYDGKLGGDKFTYRIIKHVGDSTITFQYFDDEINGFKESTATYTQKLIDQNPYMIIYYEASVSMFTRRRVCPINFDNIF